MADLEFFVLAESVSLDQLRNSLSIFHVVEEVKAAALPAAMPSLTAVSVWLLAREEKGADFQVTLVIRRPDGTESSRYPHNFTAAARRQRMVTTLQGLFFDVPGDWTFEVLLNGERAARHRVSVLPPDESSLTDAGTILPAPPSSAN